MDLFPIVYEDADLLVINKPAGLVCHPTKGDERSSLVGRVRLYLGIPGHLVNRLDRETSGVVMVAKTDPAALELRRLWGAHSVQKIYLAITHGHLETESGVITARLGKDETAEVSIRDCVREDGATAETEFRTLRRFARPEGNFTLVEARPKTGRKHQIRIHLAHLGHPIVGDKLYGLDARFYLKFVLSKLTADDRKGLILPNHALHARELQFDWRSGPVSYAAPPEPWFSAFLDGEVVPEWDTNLPEPTPSEGAA